MTPERSASQRVLIADDHPIVREGLRALLGAIDRVQIVGEVRTGAEAVVAASTMDVDVVLMDVEMPGVDGIQATRSIKASRGSDVQVLVLTAHDDRYSVVEAIRAGASGYLLKSSSLDEIDRALGAVAAGDVYVSAEVAGRALAALPGGAGNEVKDVTHREREVISLLCDGLTARSIATRLGISERTVNTHVGNLYRHLGVNNRVDAMKEAMRRGLVNLPA